MTNEIYQKSDHSFRKIKKKKTVGIPKRKYFIKEKMFGNINHIACQSFEIIFGRIWYKNKPPIYRPKNKTNLFIICAKNYYTKNIYIEWISINYIWKLQIVFVCDDVLLWNNPNFLSNSKSQKRTNLPKQILEKYTRSCKIVSSVVIHFFRFKDTNIYAVFMSREKNI